mmetsp:Transcript_43076/g.125318  ORF Transcript_43076/g.125318 Transcript_43076/m.125318 type:complete len:443 (+) Transcript_43076:140-1468(+)
MLLTWLRGCFALRANCALVVTLVASDLQGVWAASLRHGRDVVATEDSPHSVKQSRFESLDACIDEVARLANADKRAEGHDLHSDRPWLMRGGLVHDADGNRIVDHSVAGRRPRRQLYSPPAGWDYRHHGDDWRHLGECGGPWQSPVDLDRYVGVRGQTKSLLWFDYYVDPTLNASSQGNLVNDGHGLRYKVRDGRVDFGFVKVGARTYVASEYLFHAPSEHSIDGAVFPLELQIYNQAADGKVVAVGLFFREGASNPFIAAMKASLNDSAPVWTMNGQGVGKIRGEFEAAWNLEALIPKGDPAMERTFYNYQGSLTYPPCTTGVDWWVLSSPLTASREEIRFIKKAIFGSRSTQHGNARASMALENRTIRVGLIGFQHAVKGHEVPSWEYLDEYKSPRGYPASDAPWGPHWVPDQAVEEQVRGAEEEEANDSDNPVDESLPT